MSGFHYSGLALGLLLATACSPTSPPDEQSLVTASAETTVAHGPNRLSFGLTPAGEPYYVATHAGQPVVDTSRLGFALADGDLRDGFELVGTRLDSTDETWEMPWGEQRTVRNHYHELTVSLRQAAAPDRTLDVVFRAYDDGFAFRYFFPEADSAEVLIDEELTEFSLTGDHRCWWIPGDWDIYEHLYNETLLSEIDATAKRDHPALAQTYIPINAVNTPVTMRTVAGLHVSLHEADLTDYADMTLAVDANSYRLTSNLVGSERTPYKVRRERPFRTPWRTVQVAQRAGDLIESNLIVNLNEPNRLGDVSWIKPTKYVGIWWEMHLGKASWDMASGKHGATTENAKRLVDFAAENNIGAMLVEGWNTGWEHWIGFEDREGVFDFVTPYPDYDLPEVVRYGRERGVELIMHHETSAAPRTYEQQLDSAYALMESLGIRAVKTGYVGKIIPKGEYHHGQWMVNHYRKVLETAARYRVAVNAHEPIKATGIRRTLPNAIAREGLRGQEFNAWSPDGGNPPDHLPTVAFTRMLAGPIDFTPGIFNINLEPYKENNQINTTLAHQLALYVVIYSPVQMAADLPVHYEGQPAFQFIRDVGVDWERSRVLAGEVGQYVVMAREERETGNWFVGGITDEQARTVTVPLDFLDDARDYALTLYRDDATSHYADNPTAIAIETVPAGTDTLRVALAPGGGFALSALAR